MSERTQREQQPKKVYDTPVTRGAHVRPYDKVCFFLGTLGALWLAVLLAVTTPRLSWSALVAILLLWAVLAYLVLPRLNRMMATIYVPDYFIGRTRTSDGLLGDPLNLAVRGTGEQLSTALRRAARIEADPVTLASTVGIVHSTLMTLGDWPADAAEKNIAAVTVVGSVVIALMALSTLLRRALARRVLLAVAVFVAISHITSLTIADAADLQASHTRGAMTAILLTVALSSPKATDWTNR